MTTLNTIIEEENTPDAEWENDLRKRYRSQTLKMAREVSQTGDYSKVEGMIVDWWLKELTSRDTYWKERVREEVEDYFDIRLEDLVNEHLLNEDPHTETRIFEAKKNRDEILTITNEDNLK